jgi:hypothetical protein
MYGRRRQADPFTDDAVSGRVVPLQNIEDRKIETVEAILLGFRHQNHQNREFFAFWRSNRGKSSLHPR